jgi:zinc/manganese transport system substrate-binding protein
MVLSMQLFAKSQLNVVASVPDLADMARNIGGDAVTVISLSTGKEDLHAVPARPGFLPKLNKADLLFTLGLDAEHAWLPSLANEARNPKVRENGPGWVNCYTGIVPLDVPVTLDRSEGEQHPQGNPHYNIGPQCGIVMATNIEKALAAALPSSAAFFEKNGSTYRRQLEELTTGLKEKGTPLSGITIIEYHPDMAYLADFYDMKIIGSIEPKAGVPPTAGHLRELEQQAKESSVRLVIYNQSQNPKMPKKLAAAIGCKAVQIANAVGAQPEITTWIKLQRFNLQQLLNGLSGGDK